MVDERVLSKGEEPSVAGEDRDGLERPRSKGATIVAVGTMGGDRDSNARSGLVNSSRSMFDGGVAVVRGDRAYATAVYEDVSSWTLETCMRHLPFALFTAV
jgi:hypothetical protein